jgi:hypothetical protein
MIHCLKIAKKKEKKRIKLEKIVRGVAEEEEIIKILRFLADFRSSKGERAKN